MALVVGGIVHQHFNRAKIGFNFLNDSAQSGNVSKIACNEQRSVFSALREPVYQFSRSLLRNIQKRRLRSLMREMLNHGSADPRTAPGDQHHLSVEAGIAGKPLFSHSDVLIAAWYSNCAKL